MKKGMIEQGVGRREKAISMAVRRKEEYLGARVPKELRDRVVQKAKNLGIPVSILIRNVLEEAFKGEAGSDSALRDFDSSVFEDVIGWEEITLVKSVNCAGCGVQLSAAQRAALGLGGNKLIVICDVCKRKL